MSLPGRIGTWLACGALAAGISACAGMGLTQPPPPPKPQGPSDQELLGTARLRGRPPINTSRNIYEGSLWRGASSWGNLMRDHRARYAGDLLTVTEIGKITKVPEASTVKPQPIGPAAAPGAPGAQAQQRPQAPVDPLLAYIKEQEERQALIEQEQNDILRSIDTVEVEVIRTMPNGNLVVRGVHPPIFRDRNRVKYIVTLRGIVRPSDVDDKNSISALKLSKAEYKIRRLMRRSALQTAAGGKPKEGALLDRLTDFATGSGQPRARRRS